MIFNLIYFHFGGQQYARLYTSAMSTMLVKLRSVYSSAGHTPHFRADDYANSRNDTFHQYYFFHYYCIFYALASCIYLSISTGLAYRNFTTSFADMLYLRYDDFGTLAIE